MTCHICGRGNCLGSFHSAEEQEAFAPAEEAYERFIEIRAKCRAEWEDAESSDDESENDDD